jgi:hypothetical protein
MAILTNNKTREDPGLISQKSSLVLITLTSRKTGLLLDLANHQESGGAVEAAPAFRIAHASSATDLS